MESEHAEQQDLESGKTTPTMKKSMALVMPWATIMKIAPLAAVGVMTAAPRMTKPMWETEL